MGILPTTRITAAGAPSIHFQIKYQNKRKFISCSIYAGFGVASVLTIAQTEALKPCNDDDVAKGSGVVQAMLDHDLEGRKKSMKLEGLTRSIEVVCGHRDSRIEEREV